VAVMYAGQVVETAPLRDLLTRPAHPYARLLLAAMPTTRRKLASLPVIPGQMPSPGSVARGCRFRARCPVAIARCAEEMPVLAALDADRAVRCWVAA
jgi:oligopeptide/dipeptide ABC transporter ATP-binding protein